MKIELISPGWKEPSLWSIPTFRYPPLSLPTLASLTPEDFQISITDENVSPIDFEKDIDLAALTVMTPLAPRAYEIADRLRSKGTRVVLGGMHPSLLPEEAIQHADAVVIGEAEGLWQNLLQDLKQGKLQKFYKCASYPALENLPIPRRDLLPKKGYFMINTVQVTRGCPFSCDFCTVTKFFGNKHRFRPVEDIVAEIKSLKGKQIFFVDDNIVGNAAYAKKLFRALIPLKIQWMSQGSINMAADEELLRLCAKSGCVGMIIGFESVSQESLNSAGKHVNKVKDFKDSIKKLHAFGIGVDGVFVFGFDHDTKDIFKKTADFVIENNLDACQFSILTPLPGTKLYERLESEGRIIDRDWSKYDVASVVFQPKHMSPEELLEGYYWVYKQVYSYRSILKRLLIIHKNFLLYLIFNLGLRRVTSLALKPQTPSRP